MSGTAPPQDIDHARAAESNFGRMMAINGTFQYVTQQGFEGREGPSTTQRQET